MNTDEKPDDVYAAIIIFSGKPGTDMVVTAMGSDGKNLVDASIGLEFRKRDLSLPYADFESQYVRPSAVAMFKQLREEQRRAE